MMLSQIINISNYAFHTLVTNREEAVRSEKPLHCSAVTQCPTPPGSAETHTHTLCPSLVQASWSHKEGPPPRCVDHPVSLLSFAPEIRLWTAHR